MRAGPVLLLALLAILGRGTELVMPTHELKFPEGFVFGVATAAYQIEGAWNVDGKGASIWDTYSQTPGKVSNDETGNIADDHYNRVDSDTELIAGLGVSHYRMSLSWARIFPTGAGTVNQLGVEHYLKELKALKAKGLKIFVTLYHWDLPQGLEDVGGWLNRSSVDAFVAYANTSFALFGEYVDMWATFNEPYIVSWHGYGTGSNAPGRCSNRTQCTHGNTSTEPYIVGHNLLLAHAGAVAAYRTHYQSSQQAKIGIVINANFAEPHSSEVADLDATQRYLEFNCGWFANPVFYGDYPASMKEAIGDRLPEFSDEEKKLLAGSLDYFGLNHYTSVYVQADVNNTTPDHPGGWQADLNVNSLRSRHGKQIGPLADSDWLYVVPWGIRGILKWLKTNYNNPIIYISENGVDAPQESMIPKSDALQDVFRQYYLKNYLENVLHAIIEDDVQVHGYFVWSLMDNFEWSDGYQKRFGLIYVDYANNQTRTEKVSANWYRTLIAYNKGTSIPSALPPTTDVWYNAVVGLSVTVGVMLVIIGVLVSMVMKKRGKASEYDPILKEDDR